MALSLQAAPFSTENPRPAVEYWASFYGVDADMMYETLECESQFQNVQSRIYKDGVRERSFGIAQLNLDAHSSITRAQAEDQQFALSFMAREFSEGHAGKWTCFRSIFKDQDPRIRRKGMLA